MGGGEEGGRTLSVTTLFERTLSVGVSLCSKEQRLSVTLFERTASVGHIVRKNTVCRSHCSKEHRL